MQCSRRPFMKSLRTVRPAREVSARPRADMKLRVTAKAGEGANQRGEWGGIKIRSQISCVWWRGKAPTEQMDKGRLANEATIHKIIESEVLKKKSLTTGIFFV